MPTPAAGSRREQGAGGVFSHPPSLPVTSRRHRLADRFRSRVDSIGTTGVLAVVFVVALGASLLPGHISVWIGTTVYLAVGLYCSVNFWRCREAHCIITGIGFTLLGLALLVEALGIHTVIGEYNGPIALGVLALAMAFEAVWRARHGTKAVGPRTSDSDTAE